MVEELAPSAPGGIQANQGCEWMPAIVFMQHEGGGRYGEMQWVAGGGMVHPHKHPTYEFYYVTSGRGLMTIEGETREVGPGDLVLIPPDAVHSIAPISPHAPIRCFCFAMAVKGAAPYDYSYDHSAEEN